MSRHVLIAAMLIPLAGGCTDGPETAAITREASCACDVPASMKWEPGHTEPSVLFPENVDHLHTALTPAADDGAIYAWGISSGEVLWIYRVGAGDTGDFLEVLTAAWRLREIPGSGKSHAVAGTVGGKPPPSGPPGDPEFSDFYVRRVLASAQQHQDATVLMLSQLEGM